MKHSEAMERLLAEHSRQKEADAQYRDSYLCAYRDLLCWMMDEENQLDGKFEPYAGYDGPEASAKAEIMETYRKRLRALKKRYHID